ncbi:MAG: T9SS type A sorting domain-containing protein [Bacteroidota bacterium]|nr:T9SS type A sorting domain-containing protein [Bacteroidota bacterium]
MRRFLLIPALMLCIVGSSFAQYVTITKDHQIPEVEDTIAFKNANTFGFEANGQGTVMEKEWDCSAVSYTGGGVKYWWEDANTTPEAATFPNANLAYANDQENGYFYYEYNAGSDTIYRAGVYSDETMWIEYDGGRVAEFVWPYTAGDNYSWDYTGDFAPFGAGEDSVKVESGSISVEADMQGTMTLPGGLVLNNILRIRVDETFDLVAYSGGIPLVSYNILDEFYYYYHDTIQGPVCIYGLTYMNGNEESEVLRFQPFDNPVAINAQQKTQMAIFPNPTNGIVNITNVESIEVYDAIGRLLLSKNKMSKQENIDLSSYENGVYYIRMQQNGKIKSERIVLEK